MNLDKHPVRFLLYFCALLQITMLAAVSAVQAIPAPPAQLPTPPTSSTGAAIISRLVEEADLVVRAQVMQSHSRWNNTHTLIETEHRLAVNYTLIGQSTPEIVVRTDGGFLEAEGLGMQSSHTARLTPGEEVLVFLHKRANSYQIVAGEAGKFTLFNAAAIGTYAREPQTLEELIAATLAAAASQGRRTSLPTNWRSYEPPPTGRALNLFHQTLVDPRWPGAIPKIKAAVNVNSARIGEQGGSAQEFLTAIQNALQSWSVVAAAEFTFLYDGATTSTSTGFNSKSEILFMNKGAGNQLGQAQIWFTSNGTIVEADIWINDDYPFDATGALQANEIDLESTVLHELGHWLPLSHMSNPDAVMYAVLGSGVRKTILTNDDIIGIAGLYPCPAPPCIDPIYANSSTPTPTVTATSTDEATATATPTAPTVVNDPPATATITESPTLIPSAATMTPETGVYLPIITR